MLSAKSLHSFLFLALCLLLVAPAFPVPAAAAAQDNAVPAFSVEKLDGGAIGSGELLGKAYVVNFFASWCPPCRAEIPDMVALQKTYGPKGFTFIGIAVSDTEKNVREFIRRSGINYPVAMASQQVVGAFSPYVAGGLRSIPTSFVVDRNGRIVDVVTGALGHAAFEAKIVEALGKKPGKQ